VSLKKNLHAQLCSIYSADEIVAVVQCFCYSCSGSVASLVTVLATAPVYDDVLLLVRIYFCSRWVLLLVTAYCCSCSCCLFPAVSIKTVFNAVAVDLTFLLMFEFMVFI
jgi:hypothetical protein